MYIGDYKGVQLYQGHIEKQGHMEKQEMGMEN